MDTVARLPPITIRRFRLPDLGRILEIERLSFHRAAYPKELFLELHEDCGKLFYVARRAQRMVGYIVTCASAARAEVVSIAVDPACRGAGVGRALMRHTLAKLRRDGVPRLSLMVRHGNAPAIAFYLGCGFRRAGTVRRYYENGEDGLRMTLDLTPTCGRRPG